MQHDAEPASPRAPTARRSTLLAILDRPYDLSMIRAHYKVQTVLFSLTNSLALQLFSMMNRILSYTPSQGLIWILTGSSSSIRKATCRLKERLLGASEANANTSSMAGGRGQGTQQNRKDAGKRPCVLYDWLDGARSGNACEGDAFCLSLPSGQ